MPARRALGYARVSSAEQAIGTSLEDQQDVIRAYAARGGLNVHRLYVEAESAVHEKIERREQVRALLADVRRGDVVLVDKLDRWSRDPEFTYRSIRELRERGASFYAIGDACDPDTPEGDAILNLRVLLAREEHKRIKIRMVGTRKLLRDRGYYVEGSAPLGYRRQDVKGIDRNKLVVDEAGARVVRDVFRRCAAGDPIDTIAEKLGIARDLVARTLRKRVYLGEVRSTKGEWIRAQHDPIVTPAMFAAAADALDARRRGERYPRAGSETDSWWLRTIARCGHCGGKMSAAYAGPRDARRYYLFCRHRCTSRWVPVADAEDECAPLVVRRLSELRATLAAPPVRAEPARRSPEAALAGLATKRERLLHQHAEGYLSNERLREGMGKLDAERTRIEASAAVESPPDARQLRAALAGVGQLAAAWRGGSPAQRRTVVETLARSVRLALGKPALFDWYSDEDLARRG